MKCNAIPYNGKEPYIFFSFCHEDEPIVFPIIEQLAYDGYRVWYDEGIHPGADWPEVIARRLAGCEVCIAAVSEPFSKSHNCKNELTFALENSKNLMTLSLGEFTLPLGLRLQLANTQYVKVEEYPGQKLFQKLYSGAKMDQCLGEKQNIVVQHFETEVERQKKQEEQEKQEKIRQEQELLHQFELDRKEGQNYTIRYQKTDEVSEEPAATDAVALEEAPSNDIDDELELLRLKIEEAQKRLEEAKLREEEERRRREEEEALRRREEEERRRREEEERKRREEEERKRREEEERRRREEEERKRREEEERKRREEEERKRLEEEERKRLEEEEREREEAENIARLVEARRKAEEEKRLIDEQRKRNEEEKAARFVEEENLVTYERIEEDDEPVIHPASDEEYTILDTTTATIDDERTVIEFENKTIRPALIHLESSMIYDCYYPHTRLGRSEKKCDVVLKGMSTISNYHADIIIFQKRNYVIDRGSSNGTKVNGVALEQDVRCEVLTSAELQLARELFVIAFGQCADFVRNQKLIGMIMSVKTHEKLYLYGDNLLLGRSYSWPGGALQSSKISRKHAEIKYEDGAYWLIDYSTNGTYVKGRKIPQNEWTRLNENDEIAIGGEQFMFQQWILRGNADE